MDKNIVDEELITTDHIPFLSVNEVRVYALRLDKIHPVISGNKWFKLKYYLKDALDNNKKTIISFGGAYSNHIIATAAACKEYGLNSIGLIRGEKPAILSRTLQTARNYSMQLHFLSREMYQLKIIPDIFLHDDVYIIPEGGYGTKGAMGAGTISYNKDKFDTVCCATGTGTMIAGLINNKNPQTKILGFNVLKNNWSIYEEIKNLLYNKTETVNINDAFHFGGYAKHTTQLFQFMNDLYAETGIPTDFVYTGKLFYGVNELVHKKYFKPGANILLIHSGGLQGNASLRKGTLIF